MTTAPTTDPLRTRPQRADARRNYEKVLTAARDAFAERGASTSLEEIARRAEVGIGTLYRHFPTRQALLEAVYRDEVADLCESAGELAGLEPWDALAAFVHRLVSYLSTKHALAGELLDYMERDASLFKESRAALFAAGEPLLARAQEAGAARTDTTLAEVIQLFMGIAKIPALEPGQLDHLIEIALDGLRRRG